MPVVFYSICVNLRHLLNYPADTAMPLSTSVFGEYCPFGVRYGSV